MNKTIGISLGVIVIISAITWTVLAINKPNDNKMMNDQGPSTSTESQNTDNAMMADEKDNNDTLMKDEQKEVMMADESKKEVMMEKLGTYKDFSQTTLSSEQAAGKKIVLFFHANWCPFCKTADAAFQAKASEIPSGVTVLKTDYDSEKALKTKYGVTTQHTFVQIDNSGNQIAKWVSGDLAELKANLK